MITFTFNTLSTFLLLYLHTFTEYAMVANTVMLKTCSSIFKNCCQVLSVTCLKYWLYICNKKPCPCNSAPLWSHVIYSITGGNPVIPAMLWTNHKEVKGQTRIIHNHEDTNWNLFDVSFLWLFKQSPLSLCWVCVCVCVFPDFQVFPDPTPSCFTDSHTHTHTHTHTNSWCLTLTKYTEPQR